MTAGAYQSACPCHHASYEWRLTVHDTLNDRDSRDQGVFAKRTGRIHGQAASRVLLQRRRDGNEEDPVRYSAQGTKARLLYRTRETTDLPSRPAMEMINDIKMNSHPA